MEWSHLKDAVSFIADSKAILAGAGSLAVFSVFGAIPRIGLVRAFTAGWRSYLKKTYPLSRKEVTGGKGNGKSCLIDTSLNRHCGVVKISTRSGADKDLIIDQVLREITGIRVEFFKPTGSARRVLFFYSFLFKLPPTVVIRVPEHQVGQQYADVTSAVRSLADDFGLRVIVDGSPNSIPPELFTTNRETVIAVEPMTREQIESIPEFEAFIDFLKTHQLDSPVWKVLGGSPAKYLKLKEIINKLSLSNTATDVVIGQVKDHIQSVLSDALNKNIANSSHNTKEIIKVFREKKIIKIPKMELEAMGFLLDYPNKVFREVKTLDGWFVEPANSAVELIISENIHDDAGVRSLKEKLVECTSVKANS